MDPSFLVILADGDISPSCPLWTQYLVLKLYKITKLAQSQGPGVEEEKSKKLVCSGDGDVADDDDNAGNGEGRRGIPQHSK